MSLTSYHPPRPKPPPPRHLSESKLQNDPPRRLRRHVECFRHHAGRHLRFRHHQLDQLRQFRGCAPPFQLSLHQCSSQRQPVVLFHTDLGRRQKSVGDGKRPGFAIAVAAPIDGNGFQPEIDRDKVSTGGDAGFPQDRGGQQPTESRRVLEDGKLVPGIEGNDRLQYRWQVFDLAQHAASFVQPGILVPVEIIDERISLAGVDRRPVGASCVFDSGVRSG